MRPVKVGARTRCDFTNAVGEVALLFDGKAYCGVIVWRGRNRKRMLAGMESAPAEFEPGKLARAETHRGVRRAGPFRSQVQRPGPVADLVDCVHQIGRSVLSPRANQEHLDQRHNSCAQQQDPVTGHDRPAAVAAGANGVNGDQCTEHDRAGRMHYSPGLVGTR